VIRFDAPAPGTGRPAPQHCWRVRPPARQPGPLRTRPHARMAAEDPAAPAPAPCPPHLPQPAALPPPSRIELSRAPHGRPRPWGGPHAHRLVTRPTRPPPPRRSPSGPAVARCSRGNGGRGAGALTALRARPWPRFFAPSLCAAQGRRCAAPARLRGAALAPPRCACLRAAMLTATATRPARHSLLLLPPCARARALCGGRFARQCGARARAHPGMRARGTTPAQPRGAQGSGGPRARPGQGPQAPGPGARPGAMAAARAAEQPRTGCAARHGAALCSLRTAQRCAPAAARAAARRRPAPRRGGPVKTVAGSPRTMGVSSPPNPLPPF
jgi:translation initiation factor IF-2